VTLQLLTRSSALAVLVGHGLLLSHAADVEASWGVAHWQSSYPRYTYERAPARTSWASQHSRWRPVQQTSRRVQPGSWRNVAPVSGLERRGWRNARPLQATRDLVSQFRPDHRFEAVMSGAGQAPPAAQNDDLHAQFRPVQPRSRLTYEQMHPAAAEPMPMPAAPLAMPAVPYPAVPYMPPPMPVPYWPHW